MNEAVLDAMSLEGGDQCYQDSPEAPIVVPDQSGQMVEVDPSTMAAEGLAFAHRYMESNGPTTASHNLFGARKMTKNQLEEQKMNEAEGYPSNLDEAQKVKDLENKVTNIETGISQILSHLSGQSSPVSPQLSVPIGGSLGSPVGDPTQILVPSVIVSPPSPPLTVSVESNEPEKKLQPLQQVTLKDGRKISVPRTSLPAMNLGPAADTEKPPTQLEEDDWDDNPIAVVPEPELVPEGPKVPEVDPKLVKVQQLVQDVNEFLRANDVHKFWRKYLGQKVHRHVGYAGWPKKLQSEFDVRFKEFLQDPQFVTSVCRKVMNMEMGHALGSKWVASMLVATAGFTAFALCGLDE